MRQHCVWVPDGLVTYPLSSIAEPFTDASVIVTVFFSTGVVLALALLLAIAAALVDPKVPAFIGTFGKYTVWIAAFEL